MCRSLTTAVPLDFFIDRHLTEPARRPVSLTAHVATIVAREARMQPCRGRVALVTGSSRGLGRVIARQLSEAGADVVVNYRKAGGRSEAQARALAKELVERGSRAVAIQADISQKDSVAAMFQQIAAEYGRLAILVLNAARAPFKR